MKDKNWKDTVLVIAVIANVICALGWYSSSVGNVEESPEPDIGVDSYQEQVDSYRTALEEANTNIQNVNECVDSAENNVDGGLEAVLSELCTAEQVLDPY